MIAFAFIPTGRREIERKSIVLIFAELIKSNPHSPKHHHRPTLFVSYQCLLKHTPKILHFLSFIVTPTFLFIYLFWQNERYVQIFNDSFVNEKMLVIQ